MVKTGKTKADRLAERWTPTNGIKFEYPALDAIVWKYESNGKAAACAYRGGSLAPVFNGGFPSPKRRDDYVDLWIQRLQHDKGVQAASKMQFVNDCAQFYAALKLGEIFYYTDGYEQTNAHFFQVVGRIKGNGVEVRSIAHTRIESAPLAMSGHAVPRKDEFTSDVMLFKIKGAVPTIWKEGKPVRISWYG